ncbi:hypothetical protein EASAB2608_06188 [Streptomyces sp. EAS-AB2608]|uniref:hypothetical protein n=1 Tax=Streptomyces sp. EAS-AB2608 TaxID=2779671 RepID=UPI001BEFFA50|nr:hypothetical protein [Streptomyces sp. EAS-AB2608]BCM70854.1 hypothetical protein EASAB2608_06188 [Streptomyces sp. EAS-AB2608]
MGYKVKPKTYLVQFEPGHEFHGIEARLSGMSYGEWEQVTGLDGSEGETNGADSVRRFVDHLISWNLEDENDQPVPTTLDAVKQLDHNLVAALNNAWIQTLIGVHDADPLPETSPSGEPSPVASIPMAPLSPSLAS